MSTEEDEEDDSFSKLFICEEYVEKTFVFGDEFEQRLLCSNMSSTDHDLTGQIVWPASIQLSWLLVRCPAVQARLPGAVVLELGAGCGLAGFVAARLAAAKVIITDGNDVVMRLLDKNIDHLSVRDSVHAHKLLWGLKREVASVVQSFGAPDIIIGADVVLWPNMTRVLLQTVRWLLSANPLSAVCYISYIERASSVTALFMQTAAELKIGIQIEPPTSFLPDPEPASLCNVEKRLFRLFLLDAADVSFTTEPAEPEGTELALASTGAPC